MSLLVLIAEDHTIFREGLRALLSNEPDIKLVGDVEDGRSAVELAAADAMSSCTAVAAAAPRAGYESWRGTESEANSGVPAPLGSRRCGGATGGLRARVGAPVGKLSVFEPTAAELTSPAEILAGIELTVAELTAAGEPSTTE